MNNKYLTQVRRFITNSLRNKVINYDNTSFDFGYRDETNIKKSIRNNSPHIRSSFGMDYLKKH